MARKKGSTVEKRNGLSFRIYASVKLEHSYVIEFMPHLKLLSFSRHSEGVIDSSTAISISRDKLLTGSGNHRTRNRQTNRVFRSNNSEIPITA